MEDQAFELARRRVYKLASAYSDRLRRARRLFVEERAAALSGDREIEYAIKEKIALFFNIKYSEVSFAGSAQIGFSVIKNTPFIKAISDLDVACVSAELFQVAWVDVINATRAFTDSTKFSGMGDDAVDRFKDGILRRGMMRVEIMPRSDTSQRWKDFEASLSREYASYFGKITIAIYFNEYAFCWKQDSAISSLLRS